MRGFGLSLALFLAFGASAPDAEAFGRGGSNYNFFSIDGCYREDFGVLKNFHIATDIIRNDLERMYQNGQRRLRIGIFHARGASSGTLIDSSSGGLPPQYVSNLAGLIALAQQIGFVEFAIALHPNGQNDTAGWSGTGGQWDANDQSLLDENWGVLTSIMPVLRASGALYRVDLGNEFYVPRVMGRFGVNKATRYMQIFWARYRAHYSLSETTGFSVRPSEAANLSQARLVYGDTPPHLMDVHLYDTPGNTLRAADRGLREASYDGVGLVVGESYYNDAASAAEIVSAAPQLSRTVFWVMQWPLTRNSSCSDVNVAPPLDFSNYINAGL